MDSTAGRAARSAGRLLVLVLTAAVTLVAPSAAGGGTTSEVRRPAADVETIPSCRNGRPRSGCVVDGDTIWWLGTKIRLAATDAPETDHAACAAEMRAGLAARDRLRELLAGEVRVHPTGRKDRYGRVIARVTVGGADVEAILVEEGLSLPYVPGRAARLRRTARWCGPPGDD